MRTYKTLLAGAIIIGTSLTIAGTANAALTDCTGTQMCMWGNNDFVFLIAARTPLNSTIVNLTGDANNEMDSWQNRSPTYDGCMWANNDGTGDAQTSHKADSDNNVSPLNSDEVSSYRARVGC